MSESTEKYTETFTKTKYFTRIFEEFDFDYDMTTQYIKTQLYNRKDLKFDILVDDLCLPRKKYKYKKDKFINIVGCDKGVLDADIFKKEFVRNKNADARVHARVQNCAIAFEYALNKIKKQRDKLKKDICNFINTIKILKKKNSELVKKINSCYKKETIESMKIKYSNIVEEKNKLKQMLQETAMSKFKIIEENKSLKEENAFLMEEINKLINI